MGKKRRCIDCDLHINWALPLKISAKNIDYARHCLNVAERSIVCSHNMKTKPLNNEQYCKHFCKSSECQQIADHVYRDIEIPKLQNMIKDYEKGGCLNA